MVESGGRAAGAGRSGGARQEAGQAAARVGEQEPGPGPSARYVRVAQGALALLVTVGTTGQGGRSPHPVGAGDTMDQALPRWLTQAVPAVSKCPQSLQPGVGPGLAPGGPSQRNRRNNVPMRTSAFYFLPTMFSWQTRHSHDRGLGSKPPGQHNRYQRNAEVTNTSAASGTPSLGGFGARCPQAEPHHRWEHRASPATVCPPQP